MIVSAVWLAAVATVCATQVSTLVRNKCSPKDNPNDCAALIDFARHTNVSDWLLSWNWLTSASVCDWHGITCNATTGRVIGINLEFNRLRGAIPNSIGRLDKLQSLNVNGIFSLTNWPLGQMTFLNGSTVPRSLWSLTDLQSVDFGGSYVGGDLPADIGLMPAAASLQHVRFTSCAIDTVFPTTFALMRNLVELKLERNPVRGTIPFFRNMSRLEKLACNFCALTGTIPDCWDCCPKLQHLVFDGNALSGSIPSSIRYLSSLKELAFNINNITSATDDLCVPFAAPRGNGRHCHVGSDNNYASYMAEYPWIIPQQGNRFRCPLPSCMQGAGECNSTQSPVDPCV